MTMKLFTENPMKKITKDDLELVEVTDGGRRVKYRIINHPTCFYRYTMTRMGSEEEEKEDIVKDFNKLVTQSTAKQYGL